MYQILRRYISLLCFFVVIVKPWDSSEGGQFDKAVVEVTVIPRTAAVETWTLDTTATTYADAEAAPDLVFKETIRDNNTH